MAFITFSCKNNVFSPKSQQLAQTLGKAKSIHLVLKAVRSPSIGKEAFFSQRKQTVKPSERKLHKRKKGLNLCLESDDLVKPFNPFTSKL